MKSSLPSHLYANGSKYLLLHYGYIKYLTFRAYMVHTDK